MDSPATSADAGADLLDLYAFVTPLCGPGTGTACEGAPDELILALTINPFASGADRFPDDVVYHFYLENDTGTRSQIDCTFNHDQVITCEGLGDQSVQARVGGVGAQGDLRVFAGLRDDPLFFDLEAFADMDTSGVSAFRSPGVDFFAGGNVLAIVLGIRINAIPAGNALDTDIQKIWAASERIGGDGLNGGITGSWYNPAQDGQGWEVQVIRRANGQQRFVVYFYGYEAGEQLWLVGVSTIDGNTATVNMKRTSGAEWGGAFNAGDVTRETVGTMSFDFSDCNNANMSFTPGETSLTAFSTSMQRLTSISSVDCNLLTSGQIDRVGRPMVSMLFVPEELKDAYNAAPDPDAWHGLFTSAFVTGIESLDSADGITGNLLGGNAQALAELFVDDRLQIDLKQAECTDYGAVEMVALAPGAAEGCGGRGLRHDVVDDTLNVVVSGFNPDIQDYVETNDQVSSGEFPFLAPPHGSAGLPAAKLESSTPEEQGLDSVVLADMVEDLLVSRDHYRLHQVIVIRNGEIVLDVPFQPFKQDRLHHIASMGKSITTSLIGIAIDKGYIASVDEPVLSFFPGWEIANRDARKEAITIAHLLAQRSGLDIDHSEESTTMEASPNWVQWVLDQPMATDPGGEYSYTNANMHLATGILKQATGMTPLEFAHRYLYGPLGITEVIWSADPQGVNEGGGGQLHLPSDLAKLGALYLNDGWWMGQQVISAEWVTRATSVYPGEPPPGWGGGWSTGFSWAVNEQQDIIETAGSGGQVMRLWRNEGMIAVVVAGGGPVYNQCGNNGVVINQVLSGYLSNAVVSSASIPPNAAGTARLASLVEQAARPGNADPVPPLPAIAGSISGARFEMDAGPSNLEWFELTFPGGSQALLEYQDDQYFAVSVGLDNTYHASEDDNGFVYGAKGWWLADNRFAAYLEHASELRSYYGEFLFEGDDVTLTFEDVACGLGTIVVTGHRQ